MRGSSASRNPSPKKLNANMVIASASAGKIAWCGYVRMVRAPSAIMAPHDGVGGLTPRPIKLRNV